jgi:hypothetical protein
MDNCRRLLVAMVLLASCTQASWAQQRGAIPGATAPTPSAGSGQQTGQSTVGATEAETKEAQPGTVVVAPLSGAEDLSPGSQGRARSFLVPSVQWTGYADTNSNALAGRSKVETQSTLLGNITLQRVGKHSQLNLDYAGGAFFYSRRLESIPGTEPLTNGMMHRLGLTQVLAWQRWKLLLDDHLLYLPESAFGYGGFGGLGSFGGGLGGSYFSSAPTLNPTLEPNQTILTGRSQRLSNVVATQAEYRPGARSALTVTGTYGTLLFLNSPLMDNRYWALLAGYNFALSRRDVLAITYGHFLYQMGAGNREILNRGFQLAYGRKITGRLSLELSGGPMANDIAKPLGGSVLRSFWNTYDSLQYRFRKGSVGISFRRQMTGGSGLLFGAESRVAQFSAGRQLWRTAHFSLDLGHAYNQSLTQETSTSRRTKYETWQGGAMLSRELGQHMSFYLNYNVQRQISNNPLCFGDNCGTVLLRHLGGVGFNWHARPIRLD